MPVCIGPGPEAIKLFSCSAETKIYPAHKCLNANNCWYFNNCWHFNIYEQDNLQTDFGVLNLQFQYIWAISLFMRI